MGASLDIVPIGDVSEAALEGVAARLRNCGFDPSRKEPGERVRTLLGPGSTTLQAQSAIAALRGGRAKHTLGITEVELKDGARPFVYGLGEMNGSTAVFSLAQFRRGGLSLGTMLDRFCAAVLHELAHNLGMVHCRNKGCIMHAAHEPAALRQLEMFFCPSCTAQWNRRIRAAR
jgi:archaemetzincin